MKKKLEWVSIIDDLPEKLEEKVLCYGEQQYGVVKRNYLGEFTDGKYIVLVAHWMDLSNIKDLLNWNILNDNKPETHMEVLCCGKKGYSVAMMHSDGTFDDGNGLVDVDQWVQIPIFNL